MMTAKKMRGFKFMCQSPAATAVLCMTDDSRSVIVPRKSDQRTLRTFDHKVRYLLNNGDYSRFVESPNCNKRLDISVPRLKREYQDTDLNQQKPAHDLQIKPSSVLASSDNVFQVVVMRVSIHCQGCAGKLKRHASVQNGRSYIIQYRARDKEGDGDGTRFTGRSSGEHFKGEEGGVLAHPI